MAPGEDMGVRTDLIRVLVVDDHQMFAEAIQLLLRGVGDIDIVGIAGSAEQAIERCRTARPDVVLMDIDLDGMDGIEATRHIRRSCPKTRVVIVTAFQEPAVVARAFQAGATGYLPKTRATEELVSVIRQAASGDMVLPKGGFRELVPVGGPPGRERAGSGRLSIRETRVLQLLGEGMSTAAIAKELFISPFTVQSHVKRILAKMGVHSKLEAVTLGLREGVILVPRSISPRAP